jgi:hypothetical protein
MSDSALPSSSSRVRGIQERAPAVPVSERRIKTFDQLPDHLQRVLLTTPPYLTTRRAAELNGGSRSKLYEDAAEGRVTAIKNGANTLWETVSILLNLANMPPAPISPAPPRSPTPPPPRKAKAKAPPVAAAPRELAPPPERSELDHAEAAEA